MLSSQDIAQMAERKAGGLEVGSSSLPILKKIKNTYEKNEANKTKR